MLTGKQRAYLRGLAQDITPIFQIGKKGIEENFIIQVKEALEKRELIKIAVLKNCLDDPKEVAQILADRTGSQVVQVIGRKIVLYKPDKDKPKIVLPK